MSRYGGGDTTRVVYRDARDVEGGSTVSRSAAAPRSNNESYTTRKVYRVSNQDEEEERIPAFLAPRERTYGETRVVRRERTPEPEPIVERREIRIRERTPEPEPEPVVERREIRIEREREPQPEPRRYETEYRYDREIDRVAPRRDDLERYVRTVDYYPRQEAPQPIIIRQEPQQIIIQEAPRPPVVVSPPPLPTTQEESYDIIKRSEVRSEVGHRSESHRSEVGEERQIARRPKPPKPEPEEEEEDYYYERRTRRIDGRDRDDEEYESSHRRRDRERDVSPGDSISQYGRDRRGGYDSDSSYEYIKRETREDFSDEEPRHRRHLAEGAAVGLGAAELLRHHRKKKGEDEGGRGSRVGRDVGAAALGAIGAEAVTRARSHYRSKSRRGSPDRGSRDRDRDRDRDGDREGRRKHKRDKSRGKERSRSESNHRVRNLAGLGLGAAAVAAAVGYANRNAKKNEGQDRRSRSRTRRDSVGALPAPEEADDARNASHRNKKIAQAGLAGAAVAGLVERARSKSRGGGKRDRSKSRIRQGLPIAATALGSAAVAGLYEKQQAGKKEKEARREERAARRSARSRSRSHGYDASREAPVGDPGLIEYGQEPVYNQNGVPDFYNRPASQTGYYNNTEDAMVPAATAGAAYGAQAQRDMDRGQRQRSISSGSDDGRRRRRHRRHKSGSRSPSRSRDATTAALAAGAAGLAASEHEKRKQRKREKKEERRREYGLAASIAKLLTIFQVKKQLKGRRMAKIRTASNISPIVHHLLGIRMKDNRLLIILLHPAKSILVLPLPLSARFSRNTFTHNNQATHLQCPTPILQLPERLDMLRNLGSPGGLMRM